LLSEERFRTERVRVEEEAQRSEDRLRLVIDTIPTMAWTSRPDGVVDFLNRRWLDYAGLSLEEALEDTSRTMHPEDLPRVMEKWLANLAAGGGPFEAEMRLRRADGEYRWFLVRNVPLRDDLGHIVRWFATSTEIEDRKRAEEALRRSFDDRRALAARLQSVREEERTRVAREIHDELGQALTAIKFDLASLVYELPPEEKQQYRRESIMKLIDETIQTVRRISTALRPGVLDDLGLVAAVEWAAEEFEARTGTKCHTSLPDAEIGMGPEHATALFRIFQETLTNVARHADASAVHVRLGTEVGDVSLEVRDNGKGIGEAQLSAASSLGIRGIRERALLLGGEVTINGAPGKGTTVKVRIPKSSAQFGSGKGDCAPSGNG
jgi:PAS domain S-box-containing protein